MSSSLLRVAAFLEQAEGKDGALRQAIRENDIPSSLLHEFACQSAKRALDAELEAGRDIAPFCYEAIEKSRLWFAGKLGEEALDKACEEIDIEIDCILTTYNDCGGSALWTATMAVRELLAYAESIGSTAMEVAEYEEWEAGRNSEQYFTFPHREDEERYRLTRQFQERELARMIREHCRSDNEG